MKNLLFILVFFLSGCRSEYLDHIERTTTPIVSASGELYSISGELLTLPDRSVLDRLVGDIQDAQSRIWLETYIWTEKATQEAIIAAQARGVDVRIILEGNVYNTPWINTDIVKKLQSAGVEFRYADNKKYTFTHIKTWIIDDRVCVSTGNWSFTSFTKNREFIFCTPDIRILADIEEIFLADFRGVRPYFPLGLDAHIGLAPDHMRPWLETHLSQANKRIIIYNQSITDPDMLAFLEGIQNQKDIDISLCSAYREVDESSRLSYPENLQIKTSKKPYLHAKAWLIDDDRVILGSANLTANALDNNREILLHIGKNKTIFDTIYSFYDKDCHSSSLKISK